MKEKKLLWETWNLQKTIEAFMALSADRSAIYTEKYWKEHMLLKKFSQAGHPSYIIAQEFFDTMASVNLNLSPEHIPVTNSAIFIQLPKLYALSKPGEFVGGYFVGVFSLPNVINMEGKSHQKALYSTAYILDRNGRVQGDQLSSILGFYEGDTIQCAWERYHRESTDPDATQHHMTAQLLKLMIYIHSGDPDLRYLQKPKGPGDRKAQVKEFGHFYNESVFHVGFEWKKSRIFSVDSTRVRGHWRWQPYGPGRQRVKLTFVEEHERHYNSEKTTQKGLKEEQILPKN